MIKLSIEKILIAIVKHLDGNLTISSLEEILKMSHVGVWKAIKKLESEGMIILKTAGNKKNSPYIIHLNWNNSLVSKTLALAIEQEALKHKRWLFNFVELESKVDFLILYGSILFSEKEASEIDILSIISKKNISMEIDRAIIKIQQTQIKPIHNIILSPDGLKDEIKKPNMAFVSAIKEGVVLFGHDKFVAFMKEMQQ